MDARFGSLLLGIIVVVVAIGVIAGNAQPLSVAAPAPTPTPTAVPAPLPHRVNIVPNGNGSGSYDPATLTTRVGQTVTWINLDTIDHTVTADNGAFDSSVLSPGETYHWTPKKPGRYPYGDFLHPDMSGLIIVRS